MPLLLCHIENPRLLPSESLHFYAAVETAHKQHHSTVFQNRSGGDVKPIFQQAAWRASPNSSEARSKFWGQPSQ